MNSEQRMTAEDWDDAADLFEQGLVLAEMAPRDSNSDAAIKYVIKRMKSLAMFATGKAIGEREKSPNAPDEPSGVKPQQPTN